MRNAPCTYRLLTINLIVAIMLWPTVIHNPTVIAAARQGNVLTVSKTQGAAQYTTIRAALNAARAGDTIEIIDSAVYNESLSISSNRTGLTLRAREGQTPTVNGSANATISVAAQNVTIRGLKITGPFNGVQTQGQPVSNLTIEDCQFEANGDAGGNMVAVFLDDRDTATISHCQFVNTIGPAIRLFKGSSATITGNEFQGGPMNGGFADGIQLVASSADIIGNTFRNLPRFSIGTFFQAVNDPQRTSAIRIINNLMVIEGDYMPRRSAMQVVGSANTINRFVIVNNTISHVFGSIGFGLRDQQSQVMMANTIAVGASDGQDLFAYSDANPNQGSRISIHHCLIGGDQTFNSVGNNNNLTGDPRFVDASGGNYQLQPGSPAIDTGDNMAIQGFMTDLANNPRIANGDGLGMATVDIGAFELHP